MLKKTSVLVLGLMVLAPTAHAAYLTDISLSGNFALSGFNPYIDTDSNQFTYNLILSDLTGYAHVQIPAASETVSWVSSGSFSAIAGPNSIIPLTTWSNEAFNLEDFGSVAPGNYTFDFSSQEYTTTSGSSSLSLTSVNHLLAGVDSLINVDYQITALDADGILNDVVVSFLEVPNDPVLNLSNLINYFDSLPTSGQPGSIDGTFTFNLLAESVSNDVSEPMTMSLIGFGLVGLIGVRRRKNT